MSYVPYVPTGAPFIFPAEALGQLELRSLRASQPALLISSLQKRWALMTYVPYVAAGAHHIFPAVAIVSLDVRSLSSNRRSVYLACRRAGST
jgi:hypothetical protein